MAGTTPRSETEQNFHGSTRLRIHPNVLLLGVVSFFADLSSELIYPLVPLFLTSVLGAPTAVVGLIEGVAESTASLLRVVSGWFSDRVGRRKPIVMLGYGLSALAKPLLALAYVWPVVLLARFGDRVGKGLRGAPRDALIADFTPPATRGRAFGFHRMADTSGAVLGPLVALLGLWLTDNNYRLLFALAFIPGVVSLAALWPVRDSPVVAPAKPPPLSLRLAGYDRRFKLFLLVIVVFAVGNSSDAFLILRAHDVGLGTTAVVLAYVLYNLVYAGVSFPAGIASDRLGRRNVILVGYAVFAGVYLGFALVDTGGMIWPLFAVYGIYIALTDGVARAMVADLVPRERRATALGLYHTLTGLMVLFASVAAGLLWDYVSPRAPFVYGSVMALVAAVALVALLPARSTVVHS